MNSRTLTIPNDALALEASNRKQIDNRHASSIVTRLQLSGAADVARAIRGEYPNATFRSYIDISHNCHGLTLAARRTKIDNAEVSNVLNYDNYSKVEDILPGDLAIYYDSGEISHSGLVIGVDETMTFNPLILSKWGEQGPEVIHRALDTPYSNEISYFRKKPIC